MSQTRLVWSLSTASLLTSCTLRTKRVAMKEISPRNYPETLSIAAVLHTVKENRLSRLQSYCRRFRRVDVSPSNSVMIQNQVQFLNFVDLFYFVHSEHGKSSSQRNKSRMIDVYSLTAHLSSSSSGMIDSRICLIERESQEPAKPLFCSR